MKGDHANPDSLNFNNYYYHTNAWVEIWDRNRTEEEIDENEDRALAAAKIRNGVIEKVVVVKSGRGYIDPVIFVQVFLLITQNIPPHRLLF